MSQNPEKIGSENAIIASNREELARFGPAQYQQADEKGVVLIRRADYDDPVNEVTYLPRSQLAAYGLLGEGGPVIQRSVTAALDQYDPAEQILVLFLYPEDATVYLLDIEDDLLAP